LLGAIGVPATDHGRWSAFRACLLELERPAGVEIVECHGASEAQNRHVIIERVLGQGAEWIFWLDDDLLFRPDVLVKTLTRQAETGADVLIGLSLFRRVQEGAFWPIWSLQGPNDDRVLWQQVTEIQTGPNGLMRLGAGTNGGMLVQRRVYEAIGQPYARTLPDDPFHPSVDIDICWRAQRAGFEVWGDPSIRYGHMTHVAVWPHEVEGQWTAVLARGFTPFIAMPVPVPAVGSAG
jgi:hypothetical protein